MTQATGSLTDQDIATISELHDSFTRHLLAQEFDALSKLYTDDAVLMPENEPAVQGRTQLKAWFDTFPKVTRFTLDNQEIDGRDDLAFVRGTFSMTIEPEDAPGPVDTVGKFLEIRRKQPDGSWPMAVDIFNHDSE